MIFERSSGILLHPTSLPGPYGIGDLGPYALRWVDFLAEIGCRYWQVLPLGPTGYGDSPYQCFSSFAGNPYLISIDYLLEAGLIVQSDLSGKPDFVPERVDYGEIYSWKLGLLRKAFMRYQEEAIMGADFKTEFVDFKEKEKGWLEDYALFMALKDAHDGMNWGNWRPALRDREDSAIQKAKKAHKNAIERHAFWQFLFFRHWSEVRDYAHGLGIKIIGDIPIFVAYDSADVWANRDLFYLDEKGQPTVVAGVPPDYFSETGQLWGNPLYRWDKHAMDGYAWWLERLRTVFGMVDIVRLDHFRGFAGYWEVPAEAETAVNGRWVDGPGADFFETVKESLGELPIIAEDLGEITPDVIALRDQFNLPGMKIMLFAFTDDPDNEFLPHHYPENCVVYTGTHDNDTILGWYNRVEEGERYFARRYLACDEQEIHWDLIRAAWVSVAIAALAPLQDFLGLGNESRMNYPGRGSGNWKWRMRAEVLGDEVLKDRIKEMNVLYSRDFIRSEREG